MPPKIILKWSFLTRFAATTPFIHFTVSKGCWNQRFFAL